MVDHFKWALVGPTTTYVTMNCPSSDADVKSELDVQALVSLPFYSNKLSRMVVSTTYDTSRSTYARGKVNTLVLRTLPGQRFDLTRT